MATQPRGQAVRDRLLDVADRLFYQSGIQAVGVDSVVRESGIAKSTLYRWFPTKHDLVAAFLERRDELFWNAWDDVATKHVNGDGRSELHEQLQWIEEWISSPESRGCPFLNCAAELAAPAEAVEQVVRRNKTRLRRRLGELCARLVGEEHAPPLADHLHLLIDGAFATSQAFIHDGPHQRLTEAGLAAVEACSNQQSPYSPHDNGLLADVGWLLFV